MQELHKKKQNIHIGYRRGGTLLMNTEENKVLLNVVETAAYLNLGQTKTREIMKRNQNIFVVRIGNRNYAHKGLLDKWLLAQAKL